MGKPTQLEEGGAAPLQRRGATSTAKLLLCLTAIAHLCLYHAGMYNGWIHSEVEPTHRKIGNLIPTKCWNEDIKPPYQCYHMHTPLDYLNVTDKRTAKLAVVVYPAGGGNTSEADIKGTILSNPGGPGGSGVSFITSTGARFANISTGSAMDKQMKSKFNILSWDPRGVGYSTPRASCARWPTQTAECGGGLPHASSAAASCNLQGQRVSAQLCKENATLADELRFVTTASSARDMRLLYQAMGDDVLHYWGFSYGTALGSVFSDMFPEEVGRVVLDGTVDVPNYMAGNWSDNLVNTQGTYELGLLGECEKAGQKCPLNQVARSRNVDLKQLFDDFYRQLIAEPLIDIHTNTTLLTYSAFKGAIFSSLYSTYGWPNITAASAEAIQGNATRFIRRYIDGGGGGGDDSSPDAFTAIAGGDALNRREHRWNLDDYWQIIKELEVYSEFAGEIWAYDKSAIQTWSIVGKERWAGNYTSRTRNPILFVGNDYDPVTPLINSQIMATSFPRASVLRVKAFGHCSTAQPSKCAQSAIADYFVNGTLPARTTRSKDGLVMPGKWCDVDRSPWDPVDVKTMQGHQDDTSMAIMQGLHAAWRGPRL